MPHAHGSGQPSQLYHICMTASTASCHRLQVIIALQERAMGLNRSHIPYRNSMMTWLLKDSLGGNCRTAMVATINPAAEQMEESISTCRWGPGKRGPPHCAASH
jgi:hypothetical protein